MVRRGRRTGIGAPRRQGSFRSVCELIRAIEGYIADRNRDLKALVWNATAKEILQPSRMWKSIYEIQYHASHVLDTQGPTLITYTASRFTTRS